MKKHPNIHDALQSSIKAYKISLEELKRETTPGSRKIDYPLNACSIEQLKTQTFELLSTTLYQLGVASVDWISFRPELGLLRGVIQPAFSAASQYRLLNIDGTEIKPTEAPFVSGLASRIGVDPKDIYRETRSQISALEMAYWAIAEKSAPPLHHSLSPRTGGKSC